MNRNDLAEYLLDSLKASYDIYRSEDTDKPYLARCEYYEHAQRYVVFQKAELWSAKSEEFLYLFEAGHLTADQLREWLEYAWEDGEKHANIGPGHMYTYVTPVIICDSCDESAGKTLKQWKRYKSFRFSLHGWMDGHAVLISSDGKKIDSNAAGKSTAKEFRRILSLL